MPWFDVAFRVHLTSALFHAMTVGFVACAIELLSGSVVAAAIGAAALALGRIFFQGSLYAEVFPLGDLLFACIFWLAARARGAVRTGPPSARSWMALAVVLGLAFGHHPMIVLALPAVAILVARPLAASIRQRPWSCAALAALTVAIALGTYALVPWAASRDPYVSWGDVHDLPSLVRLVTRQDYGGVLHPSRHPAEGQLLERLDVFAFATFESFGPLGVLLACAGLAGAWRRDRAVAVALLVAVILAGPLFAAANAVDIHSAYRVAFFKRFFAISHVGIAVLVAIGASAPARAIRARCSGQPPQPFPIHLLAFS